MRPTPFALALSLLAVAPLPAAPRSDGGEQQLTGYLKGRVAGEPVSCIPQFRTNQSYTIDGIGVVYDVGGTRYVMRFQDGCDRLDSSTYFVTNTPTTQLCQGDVAQVYTTGGPPHTLLGVCTFGKFVPYKKES